MKEYIEIITAIIGLATAIIGCIYEEKEYRKDYKHAVQKQQQVQQQQIRDIETHGDNSGINIQTIQMQVSDILIEDQEQESQQKNFRENWKITNKYTYIFIALLYIICAIAILVFSKEKQELGFVAYKVFIIASIIFSSLSISFSIMYLYKFFRRQYKFSLKNSKEDKVTKAFRRVQRIVYPFFIILIQGNILIFLLKTDKHFFNLLFNLDGPVLFSYILLFFLSPYWFYKIVQQALLNNVYKPKFAYQSFFFALLTVIMVWNISIPNYTCWENFSGILQIISETVKSKVN